MALGRLINRVKNKHLEYANQNNLKFPFKILDNEIWMPVASVDGLWVSNLQRIWSACFLVKTVKGKNKPHFNMRVSSFITPFPQNGYLKISFQNRNYTVHSLICEAFHGERPSKVHRANHLNTDRTDNSPHNLEWATSKENSRHSVAHRKQRGDDFGATYSDNLVTEVLQMVIDGKPNKEISKETGVRSGTISLWSRGYSREHPLSLAAKQAAKKKVRSWLSASEIEQICRLVLDGQSLSEIFKKTGIKKPTISAFLNGKNRNTNPTNIVKEAREYWQKIERTKGSPGEKNYFATLSQTEVCEIKWYLSIGYRGKQLAEMYQVTPATISKIKVGRTWSNVEASMPEPIKKMQQPGKVNSRD